MMTVAIATSIGAITECCAAEEVQHQQENHQSRQRRGNAHLHKHVMAERVFGNRQTGDVIVVVGVELVINARDLLRQRDSSWSLLSIGT